MAEIQLSVLDQSPIRSGATPADAISETIELARFTDSLGYKRFWLAEHHGAAGLAGSAPEILITRVAAETQNIRVGSGGVMLSHYSPLKVAETFKTLETMYPGRIDLGVGRAPGGDGITAAALAYGSQIGLEYFPTRVADLEAFLDDAPPVTKAFENVRATPSTITAPNLWILGSSDQSAQIAAHFGRPFSYAHFINPEDGEMIMHVYRSLFRRGNSLDQPLANVCVFAICAPTSSEAQYLAKSRDLWRIQLEKGELGPYPTPEEADSYHYTKEQMMALERRRASYVVGNPEQVRSAIESLAVRFGVQEVMLLTIAHDFEARLRSYELIASAFNT